MEKYQSYKPSGVEWIGEIPENWVSSSLKRFCIIKRGSSPRPIDDPKFFDENGVYSWVRISDVTKSERYLLQTEEKLSELGSSLSTKLEPNDIFLSIAGSVGKPIINKIQCCIHDGFVWFQNLKLEKEYLYYIFKIGQCFQGLGKMGTQLNLNTDTVGMIHIPFPPLSEQHQIVQFLDEKTELIDKLISTKERKITLLKEQRTSLINQVVTKGLNPNVKMKDSGVEWIGEIPEHWMRTKIVRFCKVKDGTHDTPDYIDDIENSIPLVTSNSFVNGLIDFTKCKRISREDYIEINKRSDVTKGDIIMSMIGSNIGNKVLVNSDEEFSIKNVCLFKTSNSINLIPKYLLFLLESRFLEIQVDHSQKGGGQPFLSLDDLRNLIFPIPSVNEQNQVIQYLDLKTKEIDDLVSLEQKKIDLLKEYRQSLISEVVTGKIKVTN